MNIEDKPKKPNVRILLSLVLAVIAAILWITVLQKENTPTAAENSRALIGGPFSLTNHSGDAVSDQDFLGKYMIVYFGYTYCPDVCPMDLQIMADALRELSEEQLEEINPVFVSIDPERDTVDVMAEYVGFFHPQMIGLTGTVEQVDRVKKEYRVYAAKADDTADYLVDHTSYTYFMDKDGNLLKHFNHGEDPTYMAQTMVSLMK
ncbi:MAG: SCO family protein [Emcibacteraceae bacterium]|nr:SCO family protein [Emcibacteraceae bacterium]MDG1859538.1 SCO family protein [Emcibacteraceae bacterium]